MVSVAVEFPESGQPVVQKLDDGMAVRRGEVSHGSMVGLPVNLVPGVWIPAVPVFDVTTESWETV